MLETLEPLPGDRKCFRMINGVLTERTVEEVVPILKTNSDGLKKALEELVKQYKSRQDEMEKWKVCSVVVAVRERVLTAVHRSRTTSRSFSSRSRRLGSGCQAAIAGMDTLMCRATRRSLQQYDKGNMMSSRNGMSGFRRGGFIADMA